jgi:hypothetical protein
LFVRNSLYVKVPMPASGVATRYKAARRWQSSSSARTTLMFFQHRSGCS